MAWGATRLLWPVLLVLLASGQGTGWCHGRRCALEHNLNAQKTEFLPALKGETVSARCRHQQSQRWQVKSWCRQTVARTYTVVVDSSRTASGKPRFSIQDDGSSGVFTVTMTELRVEDLGFYWCVIYKFPEISILRVIHLVVSQGLLGLLRVLACSGPRVGASHPGQGAGRGFFPQCHLLQLQH
ncbi:PREDICTED: natural cytotoxicity triggering receptor 2 [Propithecus coquereli]|uniref:natural cytotoxicity triggering receptor 2 n=1 Tax=Propithecus coquereli TaxID=379532 RepID=UPI00063FC9F5|nr:PREDICTED: natural cytotoxicity triggering receptor 2 [Propithecus coquereli]